MERVDVGGLTIAFERRGQGPPLVLLHGGLSDHREWRRQVESLSDEFDVVAWDAPGCGASSDPPGSFRLPEYAACLAGFITEIGLERPHVLGLSWGSTLGLELYRQAPNVPRTLVLVSAYAGWAGSLTKDQVAERLESALRDLSRPPEHLVGTFIPTLFTQRAAEDMVDERATIMSSFHPDGARTMLRSMAEADLRDVLSAIDVPVLLLYGAEDVRSPRSVAEEIHARSEGRRSSCFPVSATSATWRLSSPSTKRFESSFGPAERRLWRRGLLDRRGRRWARMSWAGARDRRPHPLGRVSSYPDVENVRAAPTTRSGRERARLGYGKEELVKYIVMMFGDQATMVEVRSPEWIRSMIGFMQGIEKELADSGDLVASEGLADPSQAKIVRFQNGTPVATDGPFAEAKESLAATGSSRATRNARSGSRRGSPRSSRDPSRSDR